MRFTKFLYYFFVKKYSCFLTKTFWGQLNSWLHFVPLPMDQRVKTDSLSSYVCTSMVYLRKFCSQEFMLLYILPRYIRRCVILVNIYIPYNRKFKCFFLYHILFTYFFKKKYWPQFALNILYIDDVWYI